MMVAHQRRWIYKQSMPVLQIRRHLLPSADPAASSWKKVQISKRLVIYCNNGISSMSLGSVELS